MKTTTGMIVAGCVMIGALNAMAQTAPAEAAKPAASESVKVGVGNLAVSGLLQAWYQFTDEATPDDTFRLRRAEIKLSGEITPMVPWAVMIDPAQVREDDTTTSNIDGTNYLASVNGTNTSTSVGRKSVLQDFFVTLKLHPTSAFDIGQYKTPFGMEGLESSAKLDLIERSMLASQLKWADYRDIGVTYKGNFTCPFTGVKLQPSVGVYNGDGQNRLDANDPMAYAARLAVKPVDALHLGVAHYNGDTTSAETENNRTGVEAKIAVNPVSVYGEYAAGESAGIDKETAYVTATCMLGELFQAVARYDWYDPNKDANDDAKDEKTLGLNYLIKKHNAKLAVNYVFRGEEGASTDNDIVRALAQASF